ncbi:MAG: ABC transporter ATP-binding protein [Elusimicrobiota bacterium]
MIEVSRLSKNYGDVRAVEDVSFQVLPGEVVGLLGPNGAGKSTTLRILTGYLPPGGGQVRVGGLDIRDHPLETRRRIGYLSENNPLYEALGVWECLELTARLRGLPPEGLRRRLAKVADQCGILPVVSQDVGHLSKGYRQRLGLALAILHDPDILILDEPTSALDPNQQKEVRDLILSLREKKTVILSTHILPEAQNLCDRLLIIHRGRIAAQGTVADLQGQMQGENSYYIRLMGPEKEILPALQSVPHVTWAERVDEKEFGCPGFQVTSPGDPRPAMFELAAEKRWPILELRSRAASLDEIFQSLTSETK